MKILFTGGGTAGHIYPLIAIVREIKKGSKSQNIQFYFIGPKDNFSRALLEKEGFIVKTIFSGKMRRYFSFENIIDCFKFPLGVLQAFFYIFVISPDLIFSKGGYGSLPAVIAGKIFSTPIFLHESDAVPGLANRIAGKLALEIFTAFPVEKTASFPANKMVCVGNPVRNDVFSGMATKSNELFKITGGKPIILIIGGSQGAQFINERIISVLSELLENFEVIHQTGENNFEQTVREADLMMHSGQKEYYHPFGFLNESELQFAYNKADIIISRAGAGSIFEIALAGKPSILVPLASSAQNHQLKNAYAYSEKGAAIVMEEENFTPRFLIERLKSLFNSPVKLRDMSQKAKEFSKPDAANVIAYYIMAYLSQ